MVDENPLNPNVSESSQGLENENSTQVVETQEKEVMLETEEKIKQSPLESRDNVDFHESAVDIYEKPEKKEISTLNNNPVEDMGPGKSVDIKPDRASLGNVAGDESPLAVVMHRNEYYRDGYRTMQKAILGLAAAVAGLVVAFLVLIFVFMPPKDRFFATTPDGRLIPLAPLSEPLLQKTAIISFASEAATEVMTFGYHDYRKRLQESSSNFTSDGWESFKTALSSANYIETMVNSRQVISAIPLAPPMIVDEGLNGGVYKWFVEVPLNLSIESGSQKATKKMVVKMVLSRRSRIESNKGIGIEQWVTGSYKG